MTDFTGLNLVAPLTRAIETEGYATPTPIQQKAIPPFLEGRDLMGIAQTGTGKTAAFTLPMLQRLAESGGRRRGGTTRALVLAPTRELAGQIHDSVRTYGRHMNLRSAVVFGGVSIRPQIQAVQGGLDVLIATPGRLLDIMSQRRLRLDGVEIVVLDEADRMLDMGFIRDVRRIAAALPDVRQTAMFSATMPNAVQSLAASLLHNPVRVEVTPAATTVEKIDQRVMFVDRRQKGDLLAGLLGNDDVSRVLVFTRTKRGADKVARQLGQAGVEAGAIHGNKSQNARERALKAFRAGDIRALVATDIAARGIDVDGVTHVINFDLPVDPESYVHRIGRTARAGAGGVALSFCDADERGALRDIERTIRQQVPVDADHPFHMAMPANDAGHGKPRNGRRGGSGNGYRGQRTGPGKSQGAGGNGGNGGGNRPQRRRQRGNRAA